jgi:hypothetical protein
MKNTKQILLALGVVVLISLNACNHQNNKKANYTDSEQQSNDEIMQEWSDMEDSTQQAFDTFKSRLTDFEKSAAKANKRIAVEKQQAIINLIAKQDSIEKDLSLSKKMTKKDWDKFKTELQQELDKFKENMNAFFKNNHSDAS